MNRDIPAEEVYADNLTWREQEVLILLSERLTNREIAERLHLAESTVKDYVGKILSKLYVKNRRQAVEKAKTLGLLDGDRKAAVRPAAKLPAEPTPFIGRSDDLAEIRQLLAQTRLLTLIGPGGMGKTRLALRSALDMVGEFPHGCFFVSLAPIREVDHLLQAIAEGLKFPLATQEDPQQQLLRYLRDKQLLLVLDNFEHLLKGVEIVSEILQTAPQVKILATSRERLCLQSETLLNVGGLSFPEPVSSPDTLDYDAVSLFLQRARKVRPDYHPSTDEIKAIAEICQLVQGMPLAIELAAAWLNLLNVNDISAELGKGLDILVSEVRDAPQRHRSIQSVFDHSWSMLEPQEQEIFMRLAVFRGGFTREAAQQVASASLPQLAGLVNKSFLSLGPDSGRLEVHELLRQYAQERLEKEPRACLAALESHAAYYAQFMEQRWGDLKGERQILALAEIEADIENVRSAWRYYQDQQNVSQMWLFIKGIWYVYWIRWWNHAGMALFAEAANALQGEGVDDEAFIALKALVLAFQGYFMAWLDLADQGYQLAKDGVAILEQLDHPEALLLAYDSLLVNAYIVGRYLEEIEAGEKMLKIVTEIDDQWLSGFTIFAASMSLLVKQDYPEARRMAEKTLKLCEENGDLVGSTLFLIVLGHVAFVAENYRAAREYYLRSLEIAQQIGFPYAIQNTSKYLGKVALSIGKLEEAESFLHQSIKITNEIGFVRDIINLLTEFARLWMIQGNFVEATELLALVLKHPASQQTRMHEGRIRDSAKELLAEIEDQLPPETYMAALARGQELELEAVVAELAGSRS